MCRFDPSVRLDRANYEFVEANVIELCEGATKLGETNQPTMHTKQEVASNPKPLTEDTTFPSVPTSSDDELESRFESLRK